MKAHSFQFAAALAVALALGGSAAGAQTAIPAASGPTATGGSQAAAHVPGVPHTGAEAPARNATSVETLASSIIGMAVYDKSGSSARKIGNVVDFILDSNHHLVALVIGMGGFLGFGRKDVVIPWTRVDAFSPETGAVRVGMSRKELSKTPPFTVAERRRMKDRPVIRDYIVSRANAAESER